MIYKPVRTGRLTQKYNDNNACISPRNGHVVSKTFGTCPSGYTSLYQYFGTKSHGALDLSCYRGEPVFFPVDYPVEWEVYEREDNKGAGLGLVIRSLQPVQVHIAYLKNAHKDVVEEWANNGGKLYFKFYFWHALEKISFLYKTPRSRDREKFPMPPSAF